MKRYLTSLHDLKQREILSSQEESALKEVESKFQISITDEMVSQIEQFNDNDPIYAQFIPSIQENLILESELIDPIGDEAHSPTTGIVHRYPDRVLLKLTNLCAVYCRFCFRREMIGHNGNSLTEQQLEEAIAYIRNNPQIWEVILTGGDPLLLSKRRLDQVINQLIAIDHIKNIRIHTRIPMVAPHKIDTELLTRLNKIFDCGKSVYLVIHTNHPAEFSDNVKLTLKKIAQAGIPMLSQSVLLKNINDNLQTLKQLMQTLIINRIKPYYLHQMDLAKGTSHFRVDEDFAQQLIQQLRKEISGICVPNLIKEIPSGKGKTVIF